MVGAKNGFYKKVTFFLGLGAFLLGGQALWAQSSGSSAPIVGRKAAEKYFRSPNQQGDSEFQNWSPSSSRPAASQVLSLYVGSFISSQAYAWGNGSESVGRANYGVTYLFDEWLGFDRNLRVEFQEFQFTGVRPRKLSFSTLITFPRAESEFPLYFGAGLGLGVFLEQLPGESQFVLDYQLAAGLRFFDVFGAVGVFAEIAMKNHFNILSDGQLNGTTLVTGAVFHF